jgi:hemoglobin
MNGQTNTLYETLGEKVILELVNEFYKRVYAHPSLSNLFQNDIDEVKDKQYRFLTQFLGGPSLYIEKYGHPRMRMRHLPHAIDEKAKDEWLACMKEAIDSLKLDAQLAQALYNCFPPVAQHMVNR